MSNLLTPQQLSETPDLYSQENSKDPICHIKLFTPTLLSEVKRGN